MTQIAPGTQIGDYGIERVLGSGGMGTVYLARHRGTGAEVALKVMHPEAATSEQFRRRFLREGRVTMSLKHPNVIRILECFEHQGQPVIAMEVLRGCSLTDALQREPQPGLPRIAAILTRVTSAVGTAHALGLVHRDLKPDNIFILDDEPRVKVLDFGIAKLRKGFGLDESSALTSTGMLVGTPYYMSPEQAFGEKSIDHRADIWSLGLILHESLIGILPTKADTLQEVLKRLMSMNFERIDKQNPSIPSDVADLVERMLCREKEGRPGDLREVYDVLLRYAKDVAGPSLAFDRAAAPIMLDEPSNSTLVLDRPSAPGQSGPLKLTPQQLKRSQGGASPAGTLVIPQTPPSMKGSQPESGQTVVAPPVSVPTASARTATKRSSLWMWIVAGLVVAACVAVVITQLR